MTFTFAAVVTAVLVALVLRSRRGLGRASLALAIGAAVLPTLGAFAAPLFSWSALTLLSEAGSVALAIGFVAAQRRAPDAPVESGWARRGAVAASAAVVVGLALTALTARGCREDLAGLGCGAASFSHGQPGAVLRGGYFVAGPMTDAKDRYTFPSRCSFDVRSPAGARSQLDVAPPVAIYFGMGTGSGPGPSDYHCGYGVARLCPSAGLLAVSERPERNFLELPVGPRTRAFDLAHLTPRSARTLANARRFWVPLPMIALALLGLVLAAVASRRREARLAAASVVAVVPFVVCALVRLL